MTILHTDAQIAELLGRIRTVAVLGIKTEKQQDQAAFYVPAYAKAAGLRIVPVPVYYPEATEILGEKVHRKLVEIEEPVDLVDVFRRPSDLLAHKEDILAKHPQAVWLQTGIRHDPLAQELSDAGIDVVQDRCLMVELRRLGR